MNVFPWDVLNHMLGGDEELKPVVSLEIEANKPGAEGNKRPTPRVADVNHRFLDTLVKSHIALQDRESIPAHNPKRMLAAKFANSHYLL